MSANRRDFLKAGATAAAGLLLSETGFAAESAAVGSSMEGLPKGAFPPALVFPHFPNRLGAFVWRNWQLIPLERMAKVVGTTPDQLRRLGLNMGLPEPGAISEQFRQRSYITVIRRNWHLLPYSQLLELLEWTPEKMEFILREDDFLYVKLGNLKPNCEPLRFAEPTPEGRELEKEMKAVVEAHFSQGLGSGGQPLFSFVEELSGRSSQPAVAAKEGQPLRFCYSYFALYGDPLLDEAADPYPRGYLEKLAALGVNGVWLQGVLGKLATSRWDAAPDTTRLIRLENLRKLIARAKECGIGIYLYLNEPRSRPLGFFAGRPELKGAVEGDHSALCTSSPETQEYLVEAVAQIAKAAPDLAGFFTITGSENLTNCWSHGGGGGCPRCGKRRPAEVISEVNGLFWRGIRQAGTKARLIAWDWGWADAWAEEIIQKLPLGVSLMSVSEWSIPIRRGGISNTVGEYSISTVGPGPRAIRHWEWAAKRGLQTIAKIQAGNTWELSAVPYIPALEKVARHAVNLRDSGLDGLMLGWTLGGYPSPNLEIVSEVFGTEEKISLDEAMRRVAGRRFGKAGDRVVEAWKIFSEAFGEFPYDGGLVYNAPMQYGPSNLLWPKPTGFHATMIGFPYDDLEGWRGPYPPEIFVSQFEKVSAGFKEGTAVLAGIAGLPLDPAHAKALAGEISVAEAAQIHFETTALQAKFIFLRRALLSQPAEAEKKALKDRIAEILGREMTLAKRLRELQSADSRIGFEASNQYYYTPLDLAEKVLNCEYLLRKWLPQA